MRSRGREISVRDLILRMTSSFLSAYLALIEYDERQASADWDERDVVEGSPGKNMMPVL